MVGIPERIRWAVDLLAPQPGEPILEIDLTGDTDAFDAAIALSVNVFWTGPAARELAGPRRVLRPGDRILPPHASTLVEHGFGAVTEVRGAAGFGLTARSLSVAPPTIGR